MKTIFIAEDNETNLKLISDILTSQGYNLIIEKDGKSALASIIKNKNIIDLILMDLQLPIMDGFEVIEKLKSSDETKNLHIIVVSAHAMKHDINKAKDIGCDDYITKPIQVRNFIEKINDFLK